MDNFSQIARSYHAASMLSGTKKTGYAASFTWILSNLWMPKRFITHAVKKHNKRVIACTG